MKSAIYRIINIKTDKFYIGSAISFEKRQNDHFKALSKNKHGNSRLQRAFNKYGKENFKFEIIEEIFEKTKLLEREQYYLDTLLYAQEYIKKENDKFKQLGYNINPTAGSFLGNTHTERTKNKIRETNKNLKSFLGKSHSEKTKLEMSNLKKGKITKYNISRMKPILKCDLNNNIIKEYVSIGEAIRSNIGLSLYLILKCCNKKINQYNNFIWKYKP